MHSSLTGFVLFTSYFLGSLHGGSNAIKRNGKYRSRQRYLCKDCGKTFNDMTNTSFSGSRYPEKWVKYIKMMINGVTLPKIADSLEIHISTAFYWRNKIILQLKHLEKTKSTFYLMLFKRIQ